MMTTSTLIIATGADYALVGSVCLPEDWMKDRPV